MKNNIILAAAILFVNGLAYTQDNTVIDVDSNVYKTVTIGTQIWITENLKTTKFNDSIAIPLVTNSTEWSDLTSPGYCWFDNDEASYKATYGALYNWYSVNTEKLCPTGWHVPTDSEWKTLTDYLGGESVAGGKLKEAGTTHWASPNTGATNESGFTALPGGLRYLGGTFYDIGFIAYWWSSTETPGGNGRGRGMDFRESDVRSYIGNKYVGYSVRCMSNETAPGSSISYQIINKKAEVLQIYPNPFSQSATIAFPNQSNEHYRLVLTDLSGKVYKLVNDIATSEYVLKRGDLKSGLYFIELRGPKIYRGKIIIE